MRWGRLLFAASICSVVVFFLSLVFWGIFYKIYYRMIKKNREIAIVGKTFINSIFLAYLAAVLYITYFARNGMGVGVNLKPFEGLINIIVFRDSLNTELLFMIANILFFIPLGFLLPFVSKKINNFRRVAIVSVVFTFFIEVVQYVTKKGSFDIDDIIYNFTGGMFGFAIYSFFRTLFLESDKKKKKKKILLSFVPLIISVLVVLSVKLAYEIQEYGLIKEVNRDKTDMSRINVTCDLNLSDKKEKVPVFIADNVSISENIYSKNIKELYCNLGSSQREAIDNENEYRTKSVDGKYSINFDKKYLSYKIIFEEMNEQKEGETIVYNGENKTLTWKSEVYIDSVCNQVTDINMNDEKVRKLTNMYYEKYVKNINFIHNEGNVKILMKDMYIEYKFDNIKDDCNFSTVFIYLNNDYSIDNIEINNSLIKKYKSEEIISEKDVLDIINSGKVGLRSFNGIVDVKNISISYLVDSKEYFRPVYEVLYLYGDETQFKKIYIDAIKK